MLVLGRKPSERVVIGSEIRITVVGLEGKHVRLGIEAPAEVAVVREELIAGTRGHSPASPGKSRPSGE